MPGFPDRDEYIKMAVKTSIDPEFEFIKVPEFDLRRKYEFPEKAEEIDDKV